MADLKHDNDREVSSGDSADFDGRTEIENASVRPDSGTGPENVDADQLRANINAKIANPLAGFSHAELAQKGEEYVRSNFIGGEDDVRAFKLGAILAQDPNRHTEVDGLTQEESQVLANEITSKWSQPRLLYLVIVLCSTCAAVQGMGKFTPILPCLALIVLLNIFPQTRLLSTERKYSTASNLASATKTVLETPGSWDLSILRLIFVARSSVAGKVLLNLAKKNHG
jgi:hypothetical protein